MTRRSGTESKGDASVIPWAAAGKAEISAVDISAVDADLRGTFAEEGLELASALARSAQAWRGAPEDAVHAEEIARHLHTLKGSARSAGAMSIGEIVHATESRVLDAMHIKQASPAFLDGLQAIFDQWCEAFESARHVTQPSISAAVVNAVLGLLIAWVLCRYEFLGKRLVDSLVDLPLALPTAVAGLAEPRASQRT